MAERLRHWSLLLLLAASAAATAADMVACHYTYGGETRVLRAQSVKSPYDVATIQIGSYFRFRVVFQAEPADLGSIKIYTYADRDDSAAPIHQATYPYPQATGKSKSPYGFTGLNFVYEPMRDGELQYWCELETGNRKKR